VPPNTDFAEGILPLFLILPRIWVAVKAIAPDQQIKTNLEKLRDTGVPDHQYRMKEGSKSIQASGPFAMLVKEIAFRAAVGRHNYLWLPEIIEDICNGYRERFGESIHDEISNGLRPCIVKFSATDRHDDGLLKAALRYCWGVIHQEEFSDYANTCYVAEGGSIPRSTIQKIEFL
jgi:hypothetical protein